MDGGSGAARGLGWTFTDVTAGELLPEGGAARSSISPVGPGGVGGAKRVVALADVDTPLVGPGGGAPVFGPQKGASPAE